MNFQRTGLLVSAESPNIAASPDGICDDTVLEIKCPFKETSVATYLQNGIIQPKVRAQLQLQMWLFERPKGILCVADPKFEENGKIIFVHDEFDYDFIYNIIADANNFWIKHVLPVLIS